MRSAGADSEFITATLVGALANRVEKMIRWRVLAST